MAWRLLTFLVVAASSFACSGSVAPTTEGDASQIAFSFRYATPRPLDVFVVLNTAATPGGRAFREDVASAFRDDFRQLAAGNDLWTPVDLRVFVASTAGDVTASREWRDADATTSGAETFGAAVADALRTAPEGEASTRIVETLTRLLSATAARTDAERIIVVVSTVDDGGPAPAANVVFGADEMVVMIPAAPGPACSAVDAPKVDRWLNGINPRGTVRAPCDERKVLDLYVSRFSLQCITRPVATWPDDRHACRLRAYIPPGTDCDVARGWLRPADPRPKAIDPANEGMDVCDVRELVGDEGRACRDTRSDAYEGTASGWCIPEGGPTCRGVLPRIVGGAAPPSARMELACDLSR